MVGATGEVGRRMTALAENRGYSHVSLFASERSAGRQMAGRTVRALSQEAAQGFDLALFSAGSGPSREWAPIFARAGAVVIDNSTAWRDDPEVPLVVPEINPEALDHRPLGIVANPNCVAIICLMALAPLHRAFGLEELVVSSYQSAGGAGRDGMNELEAQMGAFESHRESLLAGTTDISVLGEAPVLKKPLAFNVVPLLGNPSEGGYTDEELKLISETRKILSLPSLKVSPTCVRVPIWIGHSASIHAVFRDEPSVEGALAALRTAPGVVLDDVPTPLERSGRGEVAVGRVRRSPDGPQALDIFVSGDNLLKGAALNAIQIADLIFPA